MTDWVAWHDKYANPNERISGRLDAIQQRIRQWLDESPPGPRRVLSVCAGQGHDLIGALEGHPRRDDVVAWLIELAPANVAAANAAAHEAGLAGVKALVGDASETESYVGRVPADLVLCCGTLGHLSRADIRRLFDALPAMCAPEGSLIWTRHRRPPDLTPEIEALLAERGFAKEAIDTSPDAPWVVGWHRFTGAQQPLEPHEKLFTFGSGDRAA